ncbi:hypothetical protein ERO13_D11G038533v2 [Gossypium hirsutum]|uniref:Phytocyanin domain-containing protein n=4 Tax=Gossypium TaxID=3633 RepID=A0A0D2QKZ0_GOSRA|nr:hypothetical protein ES319_D11G039800v1 [Gossypium barbadense]KAG4118782.1 hypothetical protein ERO13_D11G038533v2 [Gossypium hirsutum]KJB39918.1 hypothetical protein B456_007G041300 [Gossypium raimondii]TYH42116.1 hypothetical protein ES332_D11G041300v1 [Gossypium tomentosum]TYI53936.1 hypothetical protein E1A91_D11G040800v1 [Gossypium mustelinum]
MASPFSNVFFFSFLIIHFYTVICAEYEVNGDNGWIVPKHDNRTYNNWASTNRFIVNDTIRKEYDKCQTSHPQFFSNNGDTDYKLDQPGLFYFISGATGHCQRGQKMVVKVLGLQPEIPAQQASHGECDKQWCSL